MEKESASSRQSKLEFVINNISQAVIAFSSRHEKVLYNRPAKSFFRSKRG